MIGELHTDRLACSPPTHILATNNPWDRLTYCVCGKETVSCSQTNHTTWHERFIHDHTGRGAQVVGYDRYRLDVCLCHEDGLVREDE